MKIIVYLAIILTGFLSFANSTILYAQENKTLKNESVDILINWQKIHEGNLWSIFYDESKIKESTVVYLKVTNFNFIRFNLEHEIKEDVIESYKVLENLWKQVVSIDTYVDLFAGIKFKNKFLEKLVDWRKKLRSREDALKTYLDGFTANVYVEEKDIEDLKERIEDDVKIVEDLEDLRIIVQDNIFKSETAQEAYYASVLYEQQLKIHKEVIDKFKAFFTAGRLVCRGKEIKLGRKESGTKVTTILNPVGIKEAENKKTEKPKTEIGRPATIQYFVQSDMPVVFHVGYSFSRLKNIEFEKIQSLAGNDVFVQIKDEEISQNLSAFLSYELFVSNNLERSLSLTIGTDVVNPGKKIYLGASAKLFRRWFVTIAGATSEIIVGVGEENGDSQIKLFQSVKKTRKWGIVIAISISPF